MNELVPVRMSDITMLVGDVREKLREIPTRSIDCVVTSPPYWGLRDYGVEGQIGLERTLGEHLAVLVGVFREVRRVLKNHGTCFLNYGDSYAAAPNGKSAAAYKADGSDDRTFRDKPFSTVGAIFETDNGQRQASRRGRAGNLGNGGVNGVAIPRGRIVAPGKQRGEPFYDPLFATARGVFEGTQLGQHGQGTRRIDHGGRIVAGGILKPKDLCMLANRLAIALQDDGWWVRSEIIWAKPNPMPESAKDRPTCAHEKIWMLTKARKYYFNRHAVSEPLSENTHARVSQDVLNQRGSVRANGGTRADRPMKAVVAQDNGVPFDGRKRHVRKLPAGWDQEGGHHGAWNRAGRNSRENVDRVPVPRKVARHASGGPRHRNNDSYDAAMMASPYDRRNARNVLTIAPKAFNKAHFATFPPALAEWCIKAGTPLTVCEACGRPHCHCQDSGSFLAPLIKRRPGRVLDPFGGAGTVALVAQRLGLGSTTVELNAEYAAMALERCAQDLLPRPPRIRKRRKPHATRETLA